MWDDLLFETRHAIAEIKNFLKTLSSELQLSRQMNNLQLSRKQNFCRKKRHQFGNYLTRAINFQNIARKMGKRLFFSSTFFKLKVSRNFSNKLEKKSHLRKGCFFRGEVLFYTSPAISVILYT